MSSVCSLPESNARALKAGRILKVWYFLHTHYSICNRSVKTTGGHCLLWSNWSVPKTTDIFHSLQMEGQMSPTIIILPGQLNASVLTTEAKMGDQVGGIWRLRQGTWKKGKRRDLEVEMGGGASREGGGGTWVHSFGRFKKHALLIARTQSPCFSYPGLARAFLSVGSADLSSFGGVRVGWTLDLLCWLPAYDRAKMRPFYCVYYREKPHHTPSRQLWRHKVRAFVKARGIPRAV